MEAVFTVRSCSQGMHSYTALNRAANFCSIDLTWRSGPPVGNELFVPVAFSDEAFAPMECDAVGIRTQMMVQLIYFVSSETFKW
jgi:hypothetical protein